eukprot:symbB.v1.2.009945.t1/scaffold642.1/size177528/8
MADLAPLLISAPKATARLKCLGTAAPLYFDWSPHAPELLAVCHEKKLVRVVAEVASDAAPVLREPATDAGDTAAEAALAEAQVAKALAERQTRLAEQANRRVQELEQELLQLEEHVAGLEDELNKSQSQVSKFVSEKLVLKEQVATLEREISSSVVEKGGKKNFGRCKTDGIRDHDSAQEGRLHAEMLLESTKREQEEVLRAKDAELEEQRICMATLQDIGEIGPLW